MRELLALELELGHGGPIFLAIAEAITRDITRGRQRPAVRLPGSRALAQELGVHRNTVDAAYQELITQGWLQSEPARSTFVAQDLPQATMVRSVLPASAEPVTGCSALTFSDGAPDPKLVPDKALARAFRRALLSPAFRAGADYGDPRGMLSLRQALATYFGSDRGVVTNPAGLLITRGSRMALFRAVGAKLRGLPVDAGMLLIDALEAALSCDPRIRVFVS